LRIYSFNNHYIGTANRKFVKSAIKELKAMCPDVKVIDRFPEGIFTFRINLHREVFYYRLQENPPIFLRHIHPIDRMFFLSKGIFPPDASARAVTSLSHLIKPGRKISVQARRIPGEYDYTLFTFKKKLDPVLANEHYGIPAVKKPDQILSIYVSDSSAIDHTQSATCQLGECRDGPPTSWEGIVFMGVSTPQENLCEWSGGQVRFAREDRQKSRAEFKLLEAFEVFPIPVEKNGFALDLGASPGGWSRILLQKGFLVTAVDRAPLDHEIQSEKKLRFVKQDALHFRDEPDKYHIITNDINRDPVQSAQAMTAIAPSLKKNFPFVMTIKLTGKSFEKILEKVKKRLEDVFDICGIRQLFHNREEVTIWGVRK